MHTTTPHPLRGLISSLFASILFGAMFFLAGTVDAAAEAVFGWRMLVTAACFAIALLWPSSRRALAELWTTLRRAPWMPLILVATSALVGVQMWLFAWAPMHGHGLDTSLGYLLLPIMLVLSGRFLFHDRVSRTQWAAVAMAAVAVIVKLVFTASLSWVTVLVCVGYTVYFALRKRFGLATQSAFGGEIALLCIAAVPLILVSRGADTIAEQSLVLLIGLGGAAAMTAYLAASHLLSMPVFGLLTYVEPVLMFVASLLLGEHLTASDAVAYGLLAVALGVLAAGSLSRTSRTPRG